MYLFNVQKYAFIFKSPNFCQLSFDLYLKFQFHIFLSPDSLQFIIPSHLIIQLVLLHLATKVVDKLTHKRNLPLASLSPMGCFEKSEINGTIKKRKKQHF